MKKIEICWRIVGYSIDTFMNIKSGSKKEMVDAYGWYIHGTS